MSALIDDGIVHDVPIHKKKDKKKEKKKLEDKVDKTLICSQCNHVFKHPKILNCMHTFCLPCVEGMLPVQQPEANNQNVPPANPVEGQAPQPDAAAPKEAVPPPAPPKKLITCPTCHEQTEIEGEIQSLPTHFTFQNVIEVIESDNAGGPKCDECVEKCEVVDFCDNCNIAMCAKCSEAHKRSQRYRRHDIKPATEVPIEKLLTGRKFYCDERYHDGELKYFCKVCQKSICQDCPISKAHMNHEYALISDVLVDKKEEVDALLKKGRVASDSIKDFMDVSQQMLNNSETEKDKSVKAIQASFNNIQKILKTQKDKLIKDITDNHEAGRKSLDDAKKKFQVLMQLLEYSQTALETASQVSNVKVMAELKIQLEKLFTALDVDQILPTPIALPPDSAATTQPVIEVFGVVTTLFQENKGNVKVEVRKKTTVVMDALFKQNIETCKKAMNLFAQN